jgi:aquaporin Z
MNMKKYLAESICTFWLVFAESGITVLAPAFPELGNGFSGVLN